MARRPARDGMPPIPSSGPDSCRRRRIQGVRRGPRNIAARTPGGNVWCRRSAGWRRACRSRRGSGARATPSRCERRRATPAAGVGVGPDSTRVHSTNCSRWSASSSRNARRPAEGRRQPVEVDGDRRRRAPSRPRRQSARRSPSSRARASPSSRPDAGRAWPAAAPARAAHRATPASTRRTRSSRRRAASTSRAVDLCPSLLGQRAGIEGGHPRTAAPQKRRTAPPPPRAARARLYEILMGEAVAERVQQHALGGLAVAARAARLLVVRLQRARHGVVHHQPHVRLVDAHAERVGGHDHPGLLLHEGLLHLAPVVVVQAGVVRQRPDALASQHAGDALHRLARGRVDDGQAVARAPTPPRAHDPCRRRYGTTARGT